MFTFSTLHVSIKKLTRGAWLRFQFAMDTLTNFWETFQLEFVAGIDTFTYYLALSIISAVIVCIKKINHLTFFNCCD